ncbi:hypothetical protein [Mammaliicoccus lentus]|uniref:hypothetical protein n=1 Tax=Mammaliicoccus lentus TaxID=42858 RepID=UPI0010716846|nr:hypothetical protein [Mammaliicoccus lentus]MBF0748466.1 hypothetical protein [Mammaliicoccus lentus]TFU58972.1 hypothetical protein E4T93_03530 [Mammaliicoccus lentus]WQK49515.1 hypothetical protein P3U54_10930 [Mammaliicoccus lentus]
MKKLFILLFASLLVLGACGEKEETSSKSETTKQPDDKENKKQDEKKDKDKEKDNKQDTSNESEADTEEEQSAEENENTEGQEEIENSEQTNNENESENRALTKEEISKQIKSGVNVDGMVDADGDTWYQAPGNGDVVGYVKPDGTQCTVGGCVTPEQQEKMDEEETDGSTAKYDPNNPYMNLPNQEWRENAPITSGELQTRNEILNGTYEGEDAEQILEAINYYEEKYSK